MKTASADALPPSSNIYKAARLRAATHDPRLETQDGASALVNIRREKLGQIEQENPQKKQVSPSREDVARMIAVYRAPELKRHFCANCCPLGAGLSVPEFENLDRISLRLLVALQRIDQARDELACILEDGVIADAEKKELQEIMHILKSIACQTESLELWAKIKGLIE